MRIPRGRLEASAELSLDRLPGRRQRVLQLRGIAAAGLRHVVAAAPSTADDRRRLAHECRRRYAALDRRLAAERDQADLAVVGAAEHDCRVAERGLDAVGQLEQLLLVG